MVLKARDIPILILLPVSLCPALEQFLPQEKSQKIEWAVSLLPAVARDVLVITAVFSGHPGSVLDFAGLSVVAEIDSSPADMAGLRRYNSLMTASVIRAEQDEILILPFIHNTPLESYDSAAAEELKAQYADFPEIRPYLSPDFQTCVFYLEPGLTYPSRTLTQQIEELQSRIETRYNGPIEFSGLRAASVYNERLSTQDMLKSLPIVFLLISIIYFLFFRNWKLLIWVRAYP
jgi:hypothetical protein